MKKLVATLLVLASINASAKTFEVCVYGEDGIQRDCRTVSDNLELGVPSRAAPEQMGGDINPVPPTKWSNGTNSRLYKAIDAFFKALGSTGPATQPEAP